MSLALSDPNNEVMQYQAMLPRQQTIKLDHPKEFFEDLLMGSVSGSYPNQQKILLDIFRDYLHGKVNNKVAYEYERVVKHFLKYMYGTTLSITDPNFAKKLEFLDIDNPNTYRNTLASLHHFFAFLQISDYLKDFRVNYSPFFSIVKVMTASFLKS